MNHYNVGPDYRQSAAGTVKCPDCAQIVRPEYCGEEGTERCPVCFYEGPEMASAVAWQLDRMDEGATIADALAALAGVEVEA